MSSIFPDHWDFVSIENCMAAILDYRGVPPPKSPYGVPLLTAKIIKNGRILEPDEFISDIDYGSWMRRGLPQSGDVVMTTEGPLGEIAQLDERIVALGQRTITMRGNPEILDNNYLKYAMQSTFVQNQLHSRATGTTVLGISQSEMRKVLIPIPPIHEQHQIASILGTLDNKLELDRQICATQEEMARTIFQSWFVNFDPVRAKVKANAEGRDPERAAMSALSGKTDAELNALPAEMFASLAATAALFPERFVASACGEVPEGWQIKPIGECADVVGGGTPSTSEPKFWNGDIAWATPKDMSRLKSLVLMDTERRITKEGLETISSALLPKGTVLMSSRAPIGYIAIAEIPLAVNQGFIAMKPTKSLSSLFLLHWTRENAENIKSRANGSTFLEISKSNFRPLPVVVPPNSILSAFDRIVAPMYARIVLAEKETLSLTDLRDALLPKLISGALPVSAGAAECNGIGT